MGSRAFPSKYANECVRCGGLILIGQSVFYPDKDSKELCHEFCPNKPAGPVSPTPAPASAPAAPRPTFIQIAAWVPSTGSESW